MARSLLLPDISDPARFVSLTARLSLVMAALGIVYCLVQLGGIALLQALDLRRFLFDLGLELPPSLAWLATHALALGAAMLVGSSLFAVVSWGLLQRREWARLGYIAVLLVVAVANFAVLPLVDSLFTDLQAMLPVAPDDPQVSELAQQLQFSRWMTLGTSVAAALALGALHLWLCWALGLPQVRTLFRR